MSTQVQRIGGQLLKANLERELADLAFDTDLLVIKRDGTIGINTSSTPRDFVIDGVLSVDGGSDPDVIFGNSFTVGDLTVSSSGFSRPAGNLTFKTTHPTGFISTPGIGSTTQVVRDGVIEGFSTNDGIGIRSTYRAGMTEAWNSNGNYGDYWYPGPKDSASAPDNDGDRLYQEALALSQSGDPTAEELNALDYDGDGTITVTDALRILNLNTQFNNGQAFPASENLSDHANTAAFKAYVEKYYPRSAPRNLQLETGGTLTVDGNIHATGNITYGGTTITIGDDSTDTANFLAEFTTNLVPDLNDSYKLGADDDSTGPYKGWKVNVETLNVDSVQTKTVEYLGIEIGKDTQIRYVSAGNGNDDNRGDSPFGPFATIEKALEEAGEGGAVYIFPGQYQENFPLVVPRNCTVKGDTLTRVEIAPTSATQSNDAFHLKEGSAVEDITIKDFYYDSVNDRGYGFRFAPGYTNNFSKRSPYIRNVTVLTKGTSAGPSDFRGYTSGDAGRGALVDGADMGDDNFNASMLFHSVTFITPGVDGLVARNGVRVEWLNSFTYFASRGLVLEQGTVGVEIAGDSTRRYGAELRSIGSANVYGGKGAVADGADTLAYLINHNFAYVGAGGDKENDYSLVNQENEIELLNNGKIHSQYQDHAGNWRVGEVFNVDIANNNVSFDIESIFSSNSVVKIIAENSETIIVAGRITTDNLFVLDDRIISTKSDLNIASSSGNINFNQNVNMSGELDITGNFTFDGSINSLGNDRNTDSVDFNTPFDQNLLPASDPPLLGNTDDVWAKTFVNEAYINDIKIANNTIETTVSNADLELRANKIKIENLEIDGNTISTESAPQGSFVVGDTLEGTALSVFSGNLDDRYSIRKFVSVYQIPVLGSDDTSKDAVLHAANILAGYLDNNYDGVVDNATLHAQFNNGLTPIIVFKDQADKDARFDNLGSWKNNAVVILESDMNSFLGDGVNQIQDKTYERILLDLIVTKGYCQIYPDLSPVRQTVLTDLMDTARGGFQAGSLPGYNYPNFAWYTDQDGLSYTDLVYEYLYLAISTYSNTFTWRTDLASEWTLTTRLDIQNTDDIVEDLLTVQSYAFPDSTPVLGYYDEVTNNIDNTNYNLKIGSSANIVIDAVDQITVPLGTDAQRPNVTGGIRYSTSNASFQGIVGTGTVSLEGIYDTDRDTYLDLSNNQFQFVTAGNTNHTLNGTLLESSGFSSGGRLSIDGNVVSSDKINRDIVLRSNGTGFTVIEDLKFQGGDLNNTSSNVFAFDLANNSLTAYLKIDNTSGVVIPFGTDLQRRVNPDQGEIRWSLSNEYLEVYTGTTWKNAVGDVASIEVSDVDELGVLYNLILD